MLFSPAPVTATATMRLAAADGMVGCRLGAADPAMKSTLNAVSTLFILASPWVLYWTLSHHRVEVAASVLLAWVAIRSVPILLTAKSEHRVAALQLPAIAFVFALLGWAFHDGMWLLLLPSAAQAAFGLAFLRSLAAMPLVEHFARMVKPALSRREQAHCRTWTAVWGIYLIGLAAIGLALARWATLVVWTSYVGIVNYALVGLLFTVEYVTRKIRFRDYGRNPLDWVLAKLFPPPRSA